MEYGPRWLRFWLKSSLQRAPTLTAMSGQATVKSIRVGYFQLMRQRRGGIQCLQDTVYPLNRCARRYHGCTRFLSSPAWLARPGGFHGLIPCDRASVASTSSLLSALSYCMHLQYRRCFILVALHTRSSTGVVKKDGIGRMFASQDRSGSTEELI